MFTSDIERLDQAFQDRGVPTRILYDNMKTTEAKILGGKRRQKARAFFELQEDNSTSDFAVSVSLSWQRLFGADPVWSSSGVSQGLRAPRGHWCGNEVNLSTRGQLGTRGGGLRSAALSRIARTKSPERWTRQRRWAGSCRSALRSCSMGS